MAKIRVLPDSVARKIAAGEVIERPASVVKELIENSLDAGARRIVVEIAQGGRARIAVTDDGEGIAREDAVVAFQPHATSKIHDDRDLCNISTLGFRGEALPSIAAIADVELWTCPRDADVGTHVLLHAGKPVVVEEIGTPAGCRIEVRDLFNRTPARRKFLKAPVTEAGHVAQLVGRFALARPEIGFELRQDQRAPVTFPPAGRLERIRRVLGSEIEAEMREVDLDGPVRVSGFVTHPHVALANPRSILFFINGRLVRDRLLQHALMAGYGTLVPRGRYPAAVLLLGVPPEEVDVNVHPTKLEVRFRNGQAVHEAIGRAVREALQTRAAPSEAARVVRGRAALYAGDERPRPLRGCRPPASFGSGARRRAEPVIAARRSGTVLISSRRRTGLRRISRVRGRRGALVDRPARGPRAGRVRAIAGSEARRPSREAGDVDAATGRGRARRSRAARGRGRRARCLRFGSRAVRRPCHPRAYCTGAVPRRHRLRRCCARWRRIWPKSSALMRWKHAATRSSPPSPATRSFGSDKSSVRPRCARC